MPKIMFAAVLVAAALVPATAAFAAPKSVADAVAVIRSQTEVSRRVGLTIDLAGAIHDRTYGDLGDADIDAMATLLDDGNDVERMWANAALYQAGPAAARAVPQLLKAYERIRCDTRFMSSKDGIEETLRNLNVTPPPRTCP